MRPEADGTVACWGENDEGQLGDGTVTPTNSTPVQVSGLSDATAVTAGYFHSCAQRTSGALACWGRGQEARLGNGGRTGSPTPGTVTGFPPGRRTH